MSIASKIISLAAILAVAWLCPAQPATAQPATFAPLVKKQRGKVVHINTLGDTRGDAGYNLETRPGSPLPFRIPEHRAGMGSGFIISSQGLIVTNQHVISEARRIEVVLASGRVYEATVVGMDPRTDLALIKIKGNGLPATRFGDSDKMEVGDWVMAIGNPLGLDYSVTVGIVSAKGRDIFGAENVAYGEFIQTDAAINPGNSGGPLFNLKGQVIGVNTAISSRGYGIGFAVPSNIVVEVVRQLKRNGRVLRGWLGVVIQQLSRDAANSIGLPNPGSGVLVEEILPGSPAATAGINAGDVLTRFDGQKLSKVPQLQKLVAFSKPGRTIKVRGLRRRRNSGKRLSKWKVMEFTVRITDPPGQPPRTGATPLEQLGVTVSVPPDGLRRELGLRRGVGVMVRRVAPLSRAAGLGLHEGDIILQVGQKVVGSGAHLGDLLGKAPGKKLRLLVRRGRQVLYFVLKQ